MKKRIFLILAAISLTFLLSSTTLAATYEASTKLPVATGVSVTVSKVDAKGTATPDDDVWLPADPDYPLGFGNLELKEGIKDGKKWVIFLPQFYFAIDVGLLGGGFDPTRQISVSYVNTLTPPGAVGGLGDRGTITYAKTYFKSTEDWEDNKTTDVVLEKSLLKLSKSISLSSVSGGWLRMYVGIVTKDPTALYPDPDEAISFSPSDPTGDYKGELTISYL